MIKIRIKNADHEIDIRFPISENELYAKLAEIHAIEGRDAPQSAFVTDVYWPEELSMLKDRFANLDELNYLARRMESFDYHEYDQFLIGITKLENPTEKDLINLTFNLDHFTLCKDVSSYGKIGREYVMNTQGAVPANDEDDPKYAAIGKDLIDKGLAQITGKGLLIYNPFDELTEVYDGQTFPEYYYENSLASAEVSYNGRTELLLLPGEEIAIKKALARLGASSDSDCEIKFCLSQGEDDAWEERIEGIIRSEGLYEANKMLRSLDTGDMDWGKLTAAVEHAGVKSAANIAAVAEHLGEFAFIPDAKSELPMRDKIRIELSSENRLGWEPFYAVLDLPATAQQIKDARQKARITGREDMTYQEISFPGFDPLPDLEHLRLDTTTVEELNYLAQRLDALSDEQFIIYQALFDQRFGDVDSDELLSVKDLINMTYGLDSVMVASNIHNDEQLGQFVIENDLHPDVAAIPDNSLYLLDKRRIGELQRKNEGGVLWGGFYVVAGDYEIPEVYDGQNIPAAADDGVFRLKVGLADLNDPEAAEAGALWLSLPIPREEADAIVMDAFGVESIPDTDQCCRFRCSV